MDELHDRPVEPTSARVYRDPADVRRMARLELALIEIAEHPTGGVGCNPQTFVEIARKALGR